ncbi:ImmA/IrrE family metallo-endopeptidase [Roseomonas sp. OT10]|uniref:helix-turn-helix domain-containing protein n=1 Tax=Roseomonas cutis TaxID=2897332 RepID=UPI001E339C40|nr:ImmA/IrrE family metallo-endopeptidase [Roseomonas sp. OT10]UFN46809.1 ImmA/IrrE family metallo-endopeptidase [Roseomonas sp. OT10]
MLNKGFNPDMLLIARYARGLSQEEAAARARGLSQPTYSRIEAGLRAPSPTEVEAIAAAVSVRKSFFFHPFRRRPMPALFHRKRQKLTNREWERIFARAEIRRICIAKLLDAVRLTQKRPEPPLMEPSEDRDATAIAAAIRQLWLLPRGPVPDVTRLLESSGVIVVPFDFETDLIDGFSERVQDNLPPIVFVNSRQPKDRLRFTLLHELGHIVMHRLPRPEMEEEANEFAAEFLMPSADIAPDLFNTTLDHLALLKGKWRASIKSMVMAAKRLNRLSDTEYEARFRELNRRGWRVEPFPLPDDIEVPRIVPQLVTAHTKSLGFSAEDLSKTFGLPISDPESVVPPPTTPPEPKLRLIVNN